VNRFEWKEESFDDAAHFLSSQEREEEELKKLLE